MSESDIRTRCLKLMATADAVYLSAMEGGYPRIRAMLNLRNRSQYPDHAHLYEGHDEDFMIYLTTNTSSNKRRDIAADPRVGLYYCRPREYFGMSLVGDVEVIDDPAIKEAVWTEGWERYYTTTGRPDDPDYTVLRLFPKGGRGWAGGRAFELTFRR